MLYKYDELFVKTGETLRMTHMMEMDIKLKPDATTLKAKPYRTSPEMRKEINRQIDDMLKADIIEPFEGQFTSAVFLVPQKGKSFQLVVDYRKLNQQTIPENFPMFITGFGLKSYYHIYYFRHAEWISSNPQ
jgi:hypothetical protein